MDERALGEEVALARIDSQLGPDVERSYTEIGAALGMSKQQTRAVAQNAMRKLRRFRHALRVQTLLETGRELRRLQDQRLDNRPPDAKEILEGEL